MARRRLGHRGRDRLRGSGRQRVVRTALERPAPAGEDAVHRARIDFHHYNQDCGLPNAKRGLREDHIPRASYGR